MSDILGKRKKDANPTGYVAQYGYGVQPAVKTQAYIDNEGTKLDHNFTEINNLFGDGGDALVGTDRTGIASGATLAQSMDSVVQSITSDRGMLGDAPFYVLANTKNIASMGD